MTTGTLAKLLKANRRTIQRWCALLGYEREGVTTPNVKNSTLSFLCQTSVLNW
jgi:hypothetical protein